MTRDAPGPLAGVRVLEIAQYVAGPFAALTLADLGADVVKVEPPGKGDAMRTYGLRYEGLSAFWLNCNRGKRSVTLDLKDPIGVQRCRELVRRADVVVLSSRPGALDAVGLDDDTLVQLNPALVRVYVTGYGSTGPRAGEPVFDNLVQALSGLASFQSGPTGTDTVAALVVDKTTGILAAHAALAAFVERQRTGTGRRVDVSLLDAAAYWNFPDMFQDRTFVDDDRRIQRLDTSIVRTTDGRVIVAPVSGYQLARAAEAFGHPEWIDEFKTMKDHTVLMRSVIQRFDSVTSTMSTADVLELLRTFDVPAAPVLDLDQHLADPQVTHNRLYDTAPDVEYGEVRSVRYPALFDGEHHQAPFSVPRPGADVAAVARDWGLEWPVDDDDTNDATSG